MQTWPCRPCTYPVDKTQPGRAAAKEICSLNSVQLTAERRTEGSNLSFLCDEKMPPTLDLGLQEEPAGIPLALAMQLSFIFHKQTKPLSVHKRRKDLPGMEDFINIYFNIYI